MFDHAQLAGFVAVTAVLVIVPGPNTLLILANTLGGGRSAGVATVLGIEAGTFVHTIAAGLGISTLLATSSTAFAAVRYLGAVYLIVLGLRSLASARHRAESRKARAPWAHTFRRALIASVLNPKVAVFFLAFLPQFVRPERGHVLAQVVMLGAIVAVTGLTVGLALTLTLTGGWARSWLLSDVVARWQHRVTGTVLAGLGLRLALLGGG